MTESAVFHPLANLAPFLQQEANLLTEVREEIQYIRDEFERMTTFPRVADAMEDNNPELKVWVKQVREAAYDIGDVLELYMLRLGHPHGPGFCDFLRKVSCFIKTLKARHQIASEVQRMKSRVIDISKGHQSRVVLTTRNADLASFASTEYHGNVYNLQPLTPEESWTLFCRKTFMENSYLSHLEGLSKAILNRCEGLPLAIVAISGLLSTKDKSSVDEWDKIYSSLGAELQGNDKLLSMKKILSLSYIDLPYYLKFCFPYLSVFPEDCFIDHWRLIRLWVAEGFVESKAGMTIEEVAEGYLNELINRSLVQVAEMRDDRRVKIIVFQGWWISKTCEIMPLWIKRIEMGESGGWLNASS
ncbi:hypothetical protein ACSBR1_011473 [Camellia fascicularis]